MPEAPAPQQGAWWRDPGASALIARGASISKKTDAPEYSVGLGAQVFSSGQHEIDFAISRHSDGVVYVGVAVPDIAVDKTWCRRDAADQVWYYFGTGFTNALRNGWSDVVSKEVGGPEMKVPKLFPGDKVRLNLDMDAGELRFAKFSLDDGAWKDMPGKVTGINVPVVAACCIQERGDGVTLSDSAKYVPKEGDPGFVEVKKKVNKYSHVQSRLASILANGTQDSSGGEGVIKAAVERRVSNWAVKAAQARAGGAGGDARRERRSILSQASFGGLPRKEADCSRRDAEARARSARTVLRARKAPGLQAAAAAGAGIRQRGDCGQRAAERL